MIKKLYKKFVIAVVAVVLALTSFGCNQIPPDDNVSVTSITLNKTELTLNVGESETLVATINPTNATNKNVSWSSSNSSVAHVNGTGKVQSLMVGTAIIMVTTEDGGFFAVCSVTVVNPADNPEEPSNPSEPTDPVDPPVEPEEPSDPSEPTDPVDPPVEPEEPSNPDDGGDVEVPVLEVGNKYQNSANLLATVDEVGREITVGAKREEDYDVGVFYHLWHGDFGADINAQSKNSVLTSINNITELQNGSQGDVEKLWSADDVQHFYYWGEPLYGYYLPSDVWVLTRHVELFTTAGLDYICLDMTNSDGDNPRIFTHAVTQLLNVLLQFHNQGFNVPKVYFYTNTMADATVKALYNAFYTSGTYNDIWYAPNGKPMIVGITENNGNGTNQNITKAGVVTTDETLLNFFDFKDSKWPNVATNLSKQTNSVPWISWSRYAGETAGKGLEYIEVHSASNGAERDGFAAVSVGQQGQDWYKDNSGRIICHSTSKCNPESHRGYNIYTKEIEGDWKDGLAAQQLWDEVFKKKSEIKTVMVTGWNEWIAQKQPHNPTAHNYIGEPNANNTTGVNFVDLFNNEYSRDMEMMRDPDGYGDNYYLQLMYNLRKLKMTDVVKYNFPTATVDLNGDTISNLWNGVNATEYADFRGDAIARDSWDATGKTIHYVDNSNRNDIVNIKVTNDDNFYYFCIETAADITDYSGGTNWMNLYIGTEYGENTFAGFNYVINRNPNVLNGRTSLHKYNNGVWESAGGAQIRVEGNLMMIKLQRLAIDRNGAETKIRFKVTDNVQNWYVDANTEHIMDCYVSGDSAPIGRLGYVYGN